MSMSGDYRRTGERLVDALGRPMLSGLYLPAPVDDETFRDEFGFVFLDDGSVGPFYVSMDDILCTLWSRYPDPQAYVGEAGLPLDGFGHGDPAGRALALGVYNALSASLMRRAGFEAPDRAPASGLGDMPSDAPVGMIGYFSPLVEKLTERGCRVLVLERAPQRVDVKPGVSLTNETGDLRQCPRVLCTAATLINDTLEEVVAMIAGHSSLELIGPSGSGLPDPLFARGVASVGGITFTSKSCLLEQLCRGLSWGAVGRKYQLTAENYPGLDRLLAKG